MDESNRRMIMKLRSIRNAIELALPGDDEAAHLLEEASMRYAIALAKASVVGGELDRLIMEGGILDMLGDIVDKLSSSSHPDVMALLGDADIDEGFAEPVSYASPICEECGYRLDLSADMLFLLCYSCGDVVDARDLNVEMVKHNPRSRVGNFKPNRHFKRWMDHILARETEEELGDSKDPLNLRGEKMIERVREGCNRKRLTAEYMTVEDVRAILKELGLSKYNDNIPLIIKKITGRAPPSLSEDSYHRVFSMFSMVMEARNGIRREGRTNRIYYPYYIYKIMDLVLDSREERKAMDFIHLHSASTLISNDEEWRLICESIPSLRARYQPTIMVSKR